MAQRSRQTSQREQQLHHRHKQPPQSMTTLSSLDAAPPPPVPLPSLPPQHLQLTRVAPYEARMKPIRPRMILPAPAPREPPTNATASAVPTTIATTNGPGWPQLPVLPVLPVLPTVGLPPPLHNEIPIATNNAAAMTSVAVEALSSLSVAAFVMENVHKKVNTKKRIRLKTERRREQCRTNQARYRNKQRDHEVELEEYVMALRQEVQALETHKQQLLAKSSSTSDNSEAMNLTIQNPSNNPGAENEEHQLFPMQLVKEYFRLFEHGLSVEPDTTTTDRQLENEKPQYDQQEQIAFLDSVMDPALQLGDFIGVDALVRQWRKYSRYFDDLHLELANAVVIEKASLGGIMSSFSPSQPQNQMLIISTTARLTVTFTHETILQVFPHLVQTPSLRDRLVGTRVSFDSVFEFEFEVGDDQAHKVRRLNCTIDFVKSLLALLGNLADVVAVLEQAHIVSGYYLCD